MSEPIKLQHAGINNDTIKPYMSCHTDRAYRMMTTIIEDFFHQLRANAFVTAQFFIDSQDVMPNSIIIYFSNLKYAKTKFMTLKV